MRSNIDMDENDLRRMSVWGSISMERCEINEYLCFQGQLLRSEVHRSLIAFVAHAIKA